MLNARKPFFSICFVAALILFPFGSRAADFEALTTHARGNDPESFEKSVKEAKANGYKFVSIRPIVGSTEEQRTSKEDAWENFTVGQGGLFKIFETRLVKGYFKPETYKKNQEALKWKSKILQKHGMSASIRLLEPQWMATPWYKGREELKGARCDQPGVSRSAHYAINIDNKKVLKHYYQLAKKLVKLAPAIGRLYIWTNDCGGGINWCENLYPGQNGPANTKDRDMGERIQAWFQAMRDGSKAGGRELIIDFHAYHFSPPELRSVAKALRPPSRFIVPTYGVRNFPFPDFGTNITIHQEASKGTETQLIVRYSSSGSGTSAPLLFMTGEMYMGLKSFDVHYLESQGLLNDNKSPSQMLIKKCMEKCPSNLDELDNMVRSIALELVGKKHAPALYSAWKDLDFGVRTIRIDYHAGLGFGYSVRGRKWLVRPFVPVPDSLSNEEIDYWFKDMFIKDRDLELTKRKMTLVENNFMFKVEQYASTYNGYEMAMEYFKRAVDVLDKEMMHAKKGSAVWKRLKNQRDPIELLGCYYKCQFHAIGLEWIIDRFAGKPDVDKWARPREKKRMYTMIDDEIKNCEHIIQLIKNRIPDTHLIRDPEKTCLQLEKKIAIMKKHRHRVDDVFPGIAAGYQVFNYSEDGGMLTQDDAKKQLKNPKNLSKQKKQ